MKGRLCTISKTLLAATAILMLALAGCQKSSTGTDLTDADPSGAPSRILITQNTSIGPGYCEVLDTNGNLVTQKNFTSNVFDFKRWNINGAVRFTCQRVNPSGYSIPTLTGHFPCDAVIMDNNLNIIKSVGLLPYNGRTSADPDDLDVHDFILLGDNHYIAEAYYETEVNNIPTSLNPVPNCKVAAPIIQEVDNGSVVWEWDGANYPELYAASQEGNLFSDTAQVDDYAHLNAIYLDPKDNNLICSFRNLDQIMKIERGTGNILWRLGGTNSDFALTSNQKFLRQHHVTLTDNNQTLMFFDNGDNTLRPQSRVVEFQLNEAAKTITSFKSLSLPTTYYGQYQGSVQKFNDFYFVCSGYNPKIFTTMQDTVEIMFSKTLSTASYRAFMY